MAAIRKLYNADAFDDALKARLNAVEVDATLADEFWQKSSFATGIQPKKGNRKLLWFAFTGLCLTILLCGIFFKYERDENEIVASEVVQSRMPASINPKIENEKKQTSTKAIAALPQTKTSVVIKANNPSHLKKETEKKVAGQTIVAVMQAPETEKTVNVADGKSTDSLVQPSPVVSTPSTKKQTTKAPYIIW